MALREGRCLLDRRFAARGNDKSMFDSRVGGKDRYSICRVAARGSNDVYPDPRIACSSMEGSGRDTCFHLRRDAAGGNEDYNWYPRGIEEIERLQHLLIPGLRLVYTSILKQIDPEGPVWDEYYGEEDYSYGGDFIYYSSPLFDEYADEEWYYWVTGDVPVTQGKGNMIVEDDRRDDGDPKMVNCGGPTISGSQGVQLDGITTPPLYVDYLNNSSIIVDIPTKDKSPMKGLKNNGIMRDWAVITFDCSSQGETSNKRIIWNKYLILHEVNARERYGLFMIYIMFFLVFKFIKKRRSGKTNKGADVPFKLLKRLNNNVLKTRGRVFSKTGRMIRIE